MIRLKKLLRESDGDVNLNELYQEYMNIREQLNVITDFDFFGKIQELDGVTNTFIKKLDSKLKQLPDEYKDSDEYYNLVYPIYNMADAIQNFTHWASSLSNDENYENSVNKVSTLSKKIPKESNYRR